MGKLNTYNFDALSSRRAHVFEPLTPLLRAEDMNRLFRFIWSQDPHGYDHPRYRIQVALALLLHFHFGLSPTVALVESLRYGDVEVLMTKKEGITRVVLLIDPTNNKRGAKWFERRTMILADDPGNRHACAVTLFLAMATADGAFDGITDSSNLCNLSVPVWPVWGSLPIRSDLGQLPILRRVGAKSRMISSHAIKGSVLHKMMQAQIERSGYTGFSAALQLDIKHAVRREQRRMSRCCASDDSSILSPLSQRSWPLLVARSQGNNVVDLLRNELVANSFMAWTETPNTRTHSHLVVPAVVACQLKYDPSRAMIITYLYGKNAIHSQLFDVTAVFKQAALVVAHEAFFTDAAPSQNGSCPRCSICLPRIPFKYHLLKCAQLQKDVQAKRKLNDLMQTSSQVCKWAGCENYLYPTADAAAAHTSMHISSSNASSCLWNDCGYMAASKRELEQHLAACHAVYSIATIPTKSRFCFECGVWKCSEMDWALHQDLHIRDPGTIYGPIMVDGILAAPRRCLFCMRVGLFPQIESHACYIEHIKSHIREEIETSGSVECPHHSCPKIEMGMREFSSHLDSVHGIEMR